MSPKEFVSRVQELLTVNTVRQDNFDVNFGDPILSYQEDLLIYSDTFSEWIFRFKHTGITRIGVSVSFDIGQRPGANAKLITFGITERLREESTASEIAQYFEEVLRSPWKILFPLGDVDSYYRRSHVLNYATQRLNVSQAKTDYMELFAEIVQGFPHKKDLSYLGMDRAKELRITRQEKRTAQSTVRKNLRAAKILTA